MTTEPAATCGNCGATEEVATYSFDLDLPTITACPMCIMAVAQGDEDLLAQLRPSKTRRRATRAVK